VALPSRPDRRSLGIGVPPVSPFLLLRSAYLCRTSVLVFADLTRHASPRHPAAAPAPPLGSSESRLDGAGLSRLQVRKKKKNRPKSIAAPHPPANIWRTCGVTFDELWECRPLRRRTHSGAGAKRIVIRGWRGGKAACAPAGPTGESAKKTGGPCTARRPSEARGVVEFQARRLIWDLKRTPSLPAVLFFPT